MKRYATIIFACAIAALTACSGESAQTMQLKQQLAAKEQEIKMLRERLQAAEGAAAHAGRTMTDAQAQIGALNAQLSRVQAQLQMMKDEKK